MALCKFCRQNDLYTDAHGYCPICNIMGTSGVTYNPKTDTYKDIETMTDKTIVINRYRFVTRSEVVNFMNRI